MDDRHDGLNGVFFVLTICFCFYFWRCGGEVFRWVLRAVLMMEGYIFA